MTVPVDVRERAQELGLPVADHACDAHDLAPEGCDRDVLETRTTEPIDLQQRRVLAGPCMLRREGSVETTADDQGQKLGVRDVLHRRCPAHGSVPEHGDAVGDVADLAQAVCDVDDCRPTRCRLTDDLEQQFDGVL